MLAFFLPMAMTRQAAMPRRLISWPRRWSAAATMASSVTTAPPMAYKVKPEPIGR